MSLFSAPASPLASPTSLKFDIPDKYPQPHKTPIEEVHKRNSDDSLNSISSFRGVKTKNMNILKVQLRLKFTVAHFKLRKDKLENLLDLVKVIEMKFHPFNNLYLHFQDRELTPMAMDFLLQDIIMDYIMAKETIYLRLD